MSETSGLVVVGGTALNPFASYAQEQASSNVLRGDLITFDKGIYTRGKNGRMLKFGDTFTVDMSELLVGWQKWQGGKPVAAQFGAIATGYRPAPRATLGDLDESEWETDKNRQIKDPWQLTSVLYLKDGDGEELTFATSSHGGRNAISDLCKQYSVQMDSHPGGLPVVEISGDSYLHKNPEYGRIHKPIFKIVGWEGGEGGADEGYEPPQFLKGTTVPAAPKAKTKF